MAKVRLTFRIFNGLRAHISSEQSFQGTALLRQVQGQGIEPCMSYDVVGTSTASNCGLLKAAKYRPSWTAILGGATTGLAPNLLEILIIRLIASIHENGKRFAYASLSSYPEFRSLTRHLRPNVH
jgi:hypothetical protein